MTPPFGRTARRTLLGLGAALAATPALAASAPSPEPSAAHDLARLTQQLATLPRRRNFKTMPMILRHREEWDAEAFAAVLAYRGGPREIWDNTDIHGPWISVMCNTMNAEIWSFGRPDFLCVSATHGPAQLALYDQVAWEKYGLAKMAGGGLVTNRFLAVPKPAAKAGESDSPDSAFSPANSNVATLHARGAVFLACHNAAREAAAHLVQAGVNPDHASIDTVAADLANHLAPFVILTPGVLAAVAELQCNGFGYIG